MTDRIKKTIRHKIHRGGFWTKLKNYEINNKAVAVIYTGNVITGEYYRTVQKGRLVFRGQERWETTGKELNHDDFCTGSR